MESSDLFSHRSVPQPISPRDATDDEVQLPVFSDLPQRAGFTDSPS
ncbi:hypothetical protein [Mycobacterium sp. 236(2023)]|nr:hypothetical protein [Mycobacterium sp. 236(2023)]MDG4663655.1 hypothetical protein [Mycobacterium sp. 236(2023)]